MVAPKQSSNADVPLDERQGGRVSVIIPAYNYETYIADAIGSALAQTYPQIEVLVVDDGSTDTTPEIAMSFGDRITYIRQANTGLAAARNTGIARSSGGCVVFLDADDMLEPEAVATMISAAAGLGERWGIVASPFHVIDGYGTVVGSQPRAPEEMTFISYRSLLLRNRFCPVALVRRAVFDKCGVFDTEFGVNRMGSEDRDMWIRTAAEFDVVMLGEFLVRKRAHDENMSSKAAIQMASMRHALRKARRAGVVSRWNFPFWGTVNAAYHFQGALMYKEAHDRWEVLRELLRSITAYPWFCDHRKLGFPPLFRTRALLNWMRGEGKTRETPHR